MALYCKHGGLCTGCMACRSDHPMRCPVCGSELDGADPVYVDSGGQITGCGACLESREAWELLAVDRRWASP